METAIRPVWSGQPFRGGGTGDKLSEKTSRIQNWNAPLGASARDGSNEFHRNEEIVAKTPNKKMVGGVVRGRERRKIEIGPARLGEKKKAKGWD